MAQQDECSYWLEEHDLFEFPSQILNLGNLVEKNIKTLDDADLSRNFSFYDALGVFVKHYTNPDVYVGNSYEPIDEVLKKLRESKHIDLELDLEEALIRVLVAASISANKFFAPELGKIFQNTKNSLDNPLLRDFVLRKVFKAAETDDTWLHIYLYKFAKQKFLSPSEFGLLKTALNTESKEYNSNVLSLIEYTGNLNKVQYEDLWDLASLTKNRDLMLSLTIVAKSALKTPKTLDYIRAFYKSADREEFVYATHALIDMKDKEHIKALIRSMSKESFEVFSEPNKIPLDLHEDFAIHYLLKLKNHPTSQQLNAIDWEDPEWLKLFGTHNMIDAITEAVKKSVMDNKLSVSSAYVFAKAFEQTELTDRALTEYSTIMNYEDQNRMLHTVEYNDLDAKYRDSFVDGTLKLLSNKNDEDGKILYWIHIQGHWNIEFISNKGFQNLVDAYKANPPRTLSRVFVERKKRVEEFLGINDSR